MYIETLNITRYDNAGGINKSSSLHDVRSLPPFIKFLQQQPVIPSPLGGVGGGGSRGGHYRYYRYRSNKEGPTMASAPALDQPQSLKLGVIQSQTLPKSPHFLPLMSAEEGGRRKVKKELLSGIQTRTSSRSDADSAFLPRIKDVNRKRSESVDSAKKSIRSSCRIEDVTKTEREPIKTASDKKRRGSQISQNDRATTKNRKGNTPPLKKSSSTTNVFPFSFDTPHHTKKTSSPVKSRYLDTPKNKNINDSNLGRSRKNSSSLQTLKQTTPKRKRRTKRRQSSLPPSRAAKTPILDRKSTKSRRGPQTTTISTPLPKVSQSHNKMGTPPEVSGVEESGDEEENSMKGKKVWMGKTTTTTEKRTYTKEGKVFEDEVVTTVIENDEGTKTTTKTTTRQLGDDAASFDFNKVKKSLPKDRKSRSRSSSSSSDSDDGKKSKSKPPKSGGSKGLLGKLKSKTKSSSNGDDSSDDEDFAEATHKEINAIRKKHCVDKLKLNKEMSKYAKEWAVKMAKDEQMSHRPDGKYGVNMFCLSSNQKGFKVDAKKVVDQWYAESKDHKFGKEPEGTSLQTGHFSQIVWKDCKQMGVGKARSASGLKVYFVANFDPKGNWMGQFAKQVPPVGGFPKSSKKSAKARSSSSSSSSSDSSSDEEDFIEDCIKSHNDYRKKHGVQPLKKSKKLNKFSKEWAETIAKKDKMEHRSNNEYGENIYCAWSSNPKHKIKGNEAVDSWYEEIKDFTFGKEPADLRAGHFTQVVWEDSKEIGLGMARAKSGKIYVVANYSPAGNYVGSFATKVPKIK